MGGTKIFEGKEKAMVYADNPTKLMTFAYGSKPFINVEDDPTM